MISFIVPAVAVPQPRQRHRIAGKGKKQFVQNYTPADHPVNEFKAACQRACKAAYSGPPIVLPVVMSLVLVLPRTRPSWLNKQSPWWDDWKAGKRIPHAVRGDVDNFWKAASDALSKQLYADDGQIYAGRVEKWLAADNEQPHVEVCVRY